MTNEGEKKQKLKQSKQVSLYVYEMMASAECDKHRRIRSLQEDVGRRRRREVVFFFLNKELKWEDTYTQTCQV